MLERRATVTSRPKSQKRSIATISVIPEPPLPMHSPDAFRETEKYYDSLNLSFDYERAYIPAEDKRFTRKKLMPPEANEAPIDQMEHSTFYDARPDSFEMQDPNPSLKIKIIFSKNTSPQSRPQRLRTRCRYFVQVVQQLC